MRANPISNRPLWALAAVLALLVAPASSAQEGTAEGSSDPALSIEEIVVEPVKPAADTLCKLTVKLGNSHSEIASQLGFKVAGMPGDFGTKLIHDSSGLPNQTNGIVIELQP